MGFSEKERGDPAMTRAHSRPPGKNRVAVWLVYGAVLAGAPLVLRGGLALTLLSQIGVAIIACLSYNVLLGQGGMLSFGHAVYTGLGSYLVIHALNLVSAGRLPVPVSLLPVLGGVFALGVAVVLGHPTTRKAGTPFAMITLGVGELVFSLSLIIPEFFGGEGGISANRVAGAPCFGITFGPQIQLYYLIAVYCFVCTLLLYAFTETPLGRMLTAVRDNPERVEFIGYSTRRVRYYGFLVSGFFAGVAGGLGALNFELVTPEAVSAGQSGGYLLFTFLGGSRVFYGPILGAVLMVVASVLLSGWTKAWLLYLGLLFLVVVMYAPGGIGGLVEEQRKLLRAGKLGRYGLAYPLLAASSLALFAGVSALIEMIYHVQLDAALTPELTFFGLRLNTLAVSSWVGALVVLAAGAASFALARRYVLRCGAHGDEHGAHPRVGEEGL